MDTLKGSYRSIDRHDHYFNNLSKYFLKPSLKSSDLSMIILQNDNYTESIFQGHHSTSPTKTLDQLITTLFANPSDNLIDQIWEDKLKIARFKISSLASALSLRETIKDRNIYGIDKDICKIHTAQFALACSPSFDKYTINMDQINLEKTVSNLEHEKRSENTSCWKDVFMLQKDLTDAVNEYLSLKRKMDLLGINARRYSND